jgi:hypothetical protein
MNLTQTYSNHAPKPKSYVGIGLVIALHLAGIYALSAGLIKSPPRVKEATILLPPIPDKQPEREPVREIKKAEQPTLINVPKPDVLPPPTWTEETPHVVVVEQRSGEPTVWAGGSTGTGTPAVTPPAVKQDTGLKGAGAVCSVMPRPEVPAVNWSGEAVLQVVATVRGGRVVGTDFRVAQGALDSKTKRSLQRSVESALAGYQCQGDATFQQDFAFRLD